MVAGTRYGLPPLSCPRYSYKEQDCKPSSVPAEAGRDHLSSRRVTAAVVRPTRESNETGRLSSLIWPPSGRGLPCLPGYPKSGGLLPRLFTLTLRRILAEPGSAQGGMFSVALSGNRFPPALPGFLPCGARTFLPAGLTPHRAAARLARNPYLAPRTDCWASLSASLLFSRETFSNSMLSMVRARSDAHR